MFPHDFKVASVEGYRVAREHTDDDSVAFLYECYFRSSLDDSEEVEVLLYGVFRQEDSMTCCLLLVKCFNQQH